MLLSITACVGADPVIVKMGTEVQTLEMPAFYVSASPSMVTEESFTIYYIAHPVLPYIYILYICSGKVGDTCTVLEDCNEAVNRSLCEDEVCRCETGCIMDEGGSVCRESKLLFNSVTYIQLSTDQI